jgi:hypothetical protein
LLLSFQYPAMILSTFAKAWQIFTLVTLFGQYQKAKGKQR